MFFSPMLHELALEKGNITEGSFFPSVREYPFSNDLMITLASLSALWMSATLISIIFNFCLFSHYLSHGN